MKKKIRLHLNTMMLEKTLILKKKPKTFTHPRQKKKDMYVHTFHLD